SVPNTKVALIHRVIQLAVLSYTILYIIYWNKGYQTIQRPEGISIIKIKYNSTGKEGVNNNLWDSALHSFPPLEHNAFFIVTRQIFGPVDGDNSNDTQEIDTRIVENDLERLGAIH
ncbi:unnamed protein product, partial [Didymodactylos carnosus]